MGSYNFRTEARGGTLGGTITVEDNVITIETSFLHTKDSNPSSEYIPLSKIIKTNLFVRSYGNYVYITLANKEEWKLQIDDKKDAEALIKDISSRIR